MIETLEYRELDPPPALRPFVRCLWRLRGPRPAGGAPEPVVPDGRVELVLNVGDPFIRHTSDGCAHQQPMRLVAGQITRAATLEPSGRVDLWGIRFHPWSASRFLGVSGAELRDRFFSLDEACRGLERELDFVESLDGDEARFEAITAALVQRTRRIRTLDAVLPGLVGLAENSHEPYSVRGLARHAGVSTRRVQTLFRDGVGVSPKQVLRIARFQRALGLARAWPELSWSSIAAGAGYYDQAHLIRDSHDIAGSTPAVLLGRNGSLTDAFLE